MDHSGIVYSPDTSPDAIEHLLLEELRVKVLVVDVSARVTLSQVYTNPKPTTTGRCKYCFPVPANAAICAFEMRSWDGRTIVGVVKEKAQAQQEYEAAVTSGRYAGLLTYVTDDIFTISLGSVPARGTVETTLVYVMNLVNDDHPDEVRFQLPMHVGERYGTPPAELAGSVTVPSRTRVRITADIQTGGVITSITCPSHQDSISEKKYPTHFGRPSRRRTTVKFRSGTFLQRDFVLIIRSDGLDTPRCFAEHKYYSSREGPETIAMQVSLVPKFLLPPIVAQEYLFIVDRSSSMTGDRIETAKRTLAMLLRMLPSQDTLFNIFSFGRISSGLWRTSCAYDQTSLTEATLHVENMSANYGPGTEIRQALSHVLSSRANIATAVFLLTDGESYDIKETTSTVAHFVDDATSTAPLRVFVLGIGSGVSSAMCEGIARAGHGICLFALDVESILGKCARLFRAGRTPFLKNVTLDWMLTDEVRSRNGPSVNFSSLSSSTRIVQLRPLPAIQQAPANIDNIHAGTRINIFAILAIRRRTIPTNVWLRGQLDSTGEPFEVAIPVRGVQLAGMEGGSPLIHTLSAWRLVQEHEDGKAPLPQAIGVATDEEVRKAVIVQLGEKYQLATRYTSFVGVDDGENSIGIRRIDFLPRAWQGSELMRMGSAGERSLTNTFDRLFRVMLSWVSGILMLRPSQPTAGELQNAWTEANTVPGSWPETSLSESEDGPEDSNEGTSIRTFSTLSSLEQSSQWSDWSLDSAIDRDDRSVRASPRIEPIALAPEPERQRFIAARPLTSSLAPAPVRPEVVDLVKLQLYDGSFRLDNQLQDIIGAGLEEADALQIDKDVWATILCAAFIQKHLGDRKELADDFLLKTREYLAGVQGVDSLMIHALGLV